MIRNIKEDGRNNIMARFLVALLLTGFVLALPFSAGADQLPQQLRQAVTEGYQGQDRDRIMDGINESLQNGISPETLTPMVRQAARNGVDAEHLEKMLQEMTRARLADLPVGPMAAKAMEGMAKQVVAQNVVRAMEKVHERMEFASQQIDRLDGLTFSERERKQMIIGTADAEAAGMERKHVRQVYGELVKETARERSETVMKKRAMAAIESMKRIRGYGVPSERVAGIFQKMIQHQYTEMEMERVVDEFTMARNRNRNMETTSLSMEKYVDEGGRMEGSDGGGSGSGGMGDDGGSGGMGGGGGGHR